MTSSRNRFRLLFGTGLLIAGLTAMAPIAAAQDKPLNLVPSLGKATPATNTDKAPVSSAPITSAPQKNVLEGNRIKGAVVVQSLGGLNPASIGTLSATNGGLGSDMWQGSSQGRIQTLLEYLPVPHESPELQKLYRRLLLTSAAIPQGQGQPTELIRLRLEKLLAAGLVTDASDLVSRVPASSMTPELNRIATEVLLLQGQNEQACKVVDRTKAATVDNFWTKADVFCNIVAGNMPRAEIGITLLDETAGEDALFFALYDRLAGGNADLPETAQPLTALHFAMISLAKAAPSVAVLERAGNAFLWALAMDKTADVNARFTAAYKSLSIGSIPALLSRRLINEGAFLLETEENPSLGQIAALYRDALGASADAEKTRLLGDLWAAGERDGSYLAAADLSMPLLSGMTAAEYGDVFELDALRLSLVGKEEATAALWERAVRRGALRGDFAERETARKFIARADAYMLISGTTGIARWNAVNFDAEDFDHSGAAAPGDNAGLYLAILDVMGEPVPDDLWAAALGAAQTSRPGFSNIVIERNLQSAAGAGLIGETVALSIAAIGSEGPGKTSSETLVAVIRALKAIGLEAEARQLALEAAVSRNL
ncbi:hypothetical protein [Sneathiella sp.]|uniref:hypothetical protein n=1 Tax=Sneathiella sp. TaxID=1964365 RepID=UPI002601F1A3|nr:hypothetical protein [Sneathiella sp.]MDF2365724.1 hypothetical protein [Sneathiella sp.]